MDLSHGFNRFSKRAGMRRDVGIPGQIPRCRYLRCGNAESLSLTIMYINGVGMPMLVCEPCRETQYGPREVATAVATVTDIQIPAFKRRRRRK